MCSCKKCSSAQEFETDQAGTVTGTMQPAAGSGPVTVHMSGGSLGWAQGGLLPADSAPEHFRLYAAVQKEWFQPGPQTE